VRSGGFEATARVAGAATESNHGVEHDAIVVVLENGTDGQLRHYWHNNSDQTRTQQALLSQNGAGSPAVINNRLIRR